MLSFAARWWRHSVPRFKIMGSRTWMANPSLVVSFSASTAYFEHRWVAKKTTAWSVTANEKMRDESKLYFSEYYAAQKAKCQGLSLITFIGELFKFQMLTERIMHKRVKKLLGNVDNPEEEEIKSLCQLLRTIGRLLNVPKAHAHMDVYFSRMKELGKSNNVSPHMEFMLQVVPGVLSLLLPLIMVVCMLSGCD